MRKYLTIALLVLLTSLLCTAVQEQPGRHVDINLVASGTGSPTDQSGTASAVEIKDFSFSPATLSVPAGTTVTWKNQGSTPHTVTSDTQGLFDSGEIAAGGEFEFLFKTPGSFNYHCSIHSGMKGMIVVTGSAQQGSSGLKVTKTLLPGSPILGSALPGVGTQGSTDQGTGTSNGAVRKATWTQMPIGGQADGSSSGEGAGSSSTTQTKSLHLNINPEGGQGGVGSTQVMKFSKYFQMKTKAPVQKVTAPVKLELAGQEPAMLYFGSSQKAVPYQQFQTYYQTTGMNSMWIMGGTSWTQYAMVPLGAGITLAAMSPAGGYGNLYEIYPDGTLDMQGNFFYPLDQIEFYADKVGQHLLFFNIAGQPSNIVAVDVVAYQQPPAPPVGGYSDITVSSSWLLGYDVSVDGIYQATEGMTGEPDGVVSFQVPGNEDHTIDIEGNGFSFSDSRYFEAGWAYNLEI